MKLLKQEIRYEDFPVPDVLYKYREWDRPLHQTILKDRILYLSPPSGFKDKDDCRIPVRFDLLSDKEIYKRCLEYSKKINPANSKQQHGRFAKKCFKNSPLRNPKEKALIENEFWEKFNREFGVLSMTPNPASYKMWEEYTKGHKGFCVGYRGRELMGKHKRMGGIGKVEYYDKLPIIHPDIDYDKRAVINIFSKLKEWEFEDEFRAAKRTPDPKDDKWREVEVEPEIFTEIIFGALMPEDQKKEIIEVAKKNMPHVKFRQAEINPEKKEVVIRELSI